MPKPLHGVLAIAHTPFTETDEIDAAALKRSVDWAFAVGADGIGTGMVSETLQAHAPTSGCRCRRCWSSSRRVAGRCSRPSGRRARSSRWPSPIAAEKAGCDAVMAVPPLTSRRLSESHLVDHFRALADGIGIPVIVQDASGYVGQSIPIGRVREAARTLRPGQDPVQAGGGAERAERSRHSATRPAAERASSKAPAASS